MKCSNNTTKTLGPKHRLLLHGRIDVDGWSPPDTQRAMNDLISWDFADFYEVCAGTQATVFRCFPTEAGRAALETAA